MTASSVSTRKDGNLERYFSDIARYKPLSAGAEQRLAPLIRSGDAKALKKLVNANLRFVVGVARNYQNQGLPLGELIAEGNVGLLVAATRFDEKRNVKFISYAVWWVRVSIMLALARSSRPVRLPMSRVTKISRLYKVVSVLEQKLRRKPSTREIAEAVGLTEAEVTRHTMIADHHTSLDASGSEAMGSSGGEGSKGVGRMPAPTCVEQPDQVAADESDAHALAEMLDRLNERERLVLRLYFGLVDGRGHSLEEVGHELGFTRERARQIRNVALGKLRSYAKFKELRGEVV